MSTTTTAQAQKLKEIIYEKVPRLKELSFGCRVKYDWNGQEHETTITHNPFFLDYEWDHLDEYPYLREEGKRTEKHSVSIKKIIGHPIRLNHVLEAVTKDIVDILEKRGLDEKWSELEHTIISMFKLENDTLDQAIEKNPDLLPFLLSLFE